MRFTKSRRKRPNLAEAEEWLKRGHGVVMAASDYVSIQERRQRLEKLADDLPRMLRTELSRSRNLELVILKCHLLLEFMLNQFIDLVAPTEGAFEDARLTFKQKQAVVHMLGFPADPLFPPSLDVLNTIRNQAAHTLSVDRGMIDKVVRMNSEDPEEARRMTDLQRGTALRQITRFYCAQMLGVIQAKREFEWLEQTAEPRASADGAPRRR